MSSTRRATSRPRARGGAAATSSASASVGASHGGDVHRVPAAACWGAYALAAAAGVAAGSGASDATSTFYNSLPTWLQTAQDPLWVGFVATLAATTAVFVVSLTWRNSSVYDPYWVLAPTALTVYWVLAGDSFADDSDDAGLASRVSAAFTRLSLRQCIAMALVWVWSIRFTVALPWEGWTQGLEHEDWRYEQIWHQCKGTLGRAAAPVYWMISYLSFHVTPTVLVYAGIAPLGKLLLLDERAAPALSTTETVAWVAAAVVTAGAIAVEAVADEQLKAFRRSLRQRATKGAKVPKVCTDGLWGACRHPNYFGECSFWFGCWLQAAAAGVAPPPPEAWLGAGWFAMTVFFRTVSVPLMDARSVQRRGKEYERVMQTTSAMMLWPPTPPPGQKRRAARDVGRNVSAAAAFALAAAAAIVWAPPARAEAAMVKSDGTCTSDVDCSLNGDCVNGACVCDAPWSGSPACDVMSFLPTDLGHSGYRNATEASWGGNVVRTDDGVYHLFVAQMVNHCPLQDWGSNSAIVRATSANANGPFQYAETVLQPWAHNPTIRQLPDGSFLLAFIGTGTGTPPVPKDCTPNATRPPASVSASDGARAGQPSSIWLARAPAVTGPWELSQANFTHNDANFTQWLQGGFTNPSPHVAPDGSVTLAFQAGPIGKSLELIGVARAPTWRGPWEIITPDPIIPQQWYCLAGTGEDPFLWRSRRGWHVIIHGMCPAGVFNARYAFSADAVHWLDSPRQTWNYTVDLVGGSSHTFARVERPQLVFAGHNATDGTFSDPLYLTNGVCDGLECLWNPGMTYTMFRPLRKAVQRLGPAPA